jgi:hypothetical protein
MIRLEQCRTNPNHWYSGHAGECPWCRIASDTGRDSFPGPDTPNFTYGSATLSQPSVILPPAGAGSSAPAAASSSRNIMIGLAGIIVVVIVLFIIMGNSTTTHTGGGTLPVTRTPIPLTTYPVTERPTIIQQTPASATMTPQNGLMTYSNAANRFSITYPAGWNVNGDNSVVSFSPGNDPVLSISTAQKPGSLQDYFLEQGPKKVKTNSYAEITNHDFKCNLGYRIDYIIRESDTIATTKVTQIFAEGHTKSQVFVLTYKGSGSGYDQYSGVVDDMTRSFRLT